MMNTVGTEDFRLMVANNQDFMLIDIRSPNRYRLAHIPDAINIPLDEPFLAQNVKEVAGEMDARIVVYGEDNDNELVKSAIRQLADAGFSNVACYDAGVRGWQDSGLATEPG